MKAPWKGLIVIVLLIFAVGVGAQEEERVKTVEELFFVDPMLGSLLDQATSISRESKLSALDDIKEMLDDKNLGDPDLVFDILELLSAEGARRMVRSGQLGLRPASGLGRRGEAGASAGARSRALPGCRRSDPRRARASV